MRRYAWLEFESGMWHLLTHLDAEAAESTRKWSDEQRALEELMEEGWTIVSPYPNRLSTWRESAEQLFGYGLTRTVH